MWYALCVPMCAIVEAHFASFASSADSTAFSHAVITSSNAFHSLCPILRVKGLKRLVVVPAVFALGFAVESRETPAIPENDVAS